MSDIVVENLYKSYGAPVLNGLTTVFPAGRITCVMGPSGCGKSTLLNILMGLETPDSGSIRGVPHHIAAVFQENRFCESFNGVTNVRLVSPGLSRTEAAEQLTLLGLGDSLKKPVSELSGGMRRRVALCRALLADSEAVFLDEPFTGLDPDTRAAALDYVVKNTAGKTVILVSHDPIVHRDIEPAVLMLG